ncbi:MAG TPA: hypothetical protein VGT24_10060 [Candidatus Acidoferrales bacterium]|nr:hypothetical protein [Candidatus Acidoferrales bacterium]
MSRRNRQRDYPDLLTTLLGMRLSEIEWTAPRISKRTQNRLRAQAAKIGKVIIDDWMRAAKERLAEVGRLIAADALDQRRREDDERARRDYAETVAIAERMADALLPVVRSEYNAACRRLRAEIKQEQEIIRKAGRRIARAKLARFKARR